MSILRKTEWITRSNNQTFNSEWAEDILETKIKNKISILRKTEWITRSNNQTFNSEWAVIWAIKKKSTFKRKSESLSRRRLGTN